MSSETPAKIHDLVEKDSINLYTHFLKKFEKGAKVLCDTPESCDSFSVFVIDMQNDFVLPNGRFSVANGLDMAPRLAEFIENSLNDSKCTKVIFSRDTHDVNHCSFFTNGGPFPPHCVINHSGAEMHDSMKKFGIKRGDNNINNSKRDSWNKKIRVIFKGCDENTDSFGAVEYEDDEYSKGRQLGENCKLVTGKTGGRYFKGSEKAFNDIPFRSAPFSDIPVCHATTDTIGAKDYYPTEEICPKSKFSDEKQQKYLGKQLEVEDLIDRKKNNSGKDLVHNIYVTGLAGDYCVKDTAMNIMKTLKKAPVSGYKINVYVIHPLVRFAFLPVHLAGGISQVYKGKNISKNDDISMLTITDRGVKDVNKYIFKMHGDDIKPLKKEEVETLKSDLNAGTSLKDLNKSFEYWAFLTPTSHIIRDYANTGVKILMKEPEFDSNMRGGSTRRRGRAKRSTRRN